jgi:hypothetical protein
MPKSRRTKVKEGNWIRCDERTDVIVSLGLCQRLIGTLNEDKLMWKWAILALHNALQGAMVCHLSGTAQVGALDKKSIEDFAKWHERDRKGEIKKIQKGVSDFGIPIMKILNKKDNPPNEYLASTDVLFERLHKASERFEAGAGAILVLSDSQKASFNKLHLLRNSFMHFTLKSWSIEISGLPNIFLDIFDIIEMIVADPWPFRHLEEAEKVKLNKLVTELKAGVNKIRFC